MTVRLVSSNDPRALVVRDHVLRHVRAQGRIELQDGQLRLVRLQLGPFQCSHWTPFRNLGSEEASSPGYRHALQRQRDEPDLPYGLRITRDGTNLLTLLWAEDGRFAVVQFLPGKWEEEVCAL